MDPDHWRYYSRSSQGFDFILAWCWHSWFSLPDMFCIFWIIASSQITVYLPVLPLSPFLITSSAVPCSKFWNSWPSLPIPVVFLLYHDKNSWVTLDILLSLSFHALFIYVSSVSGHLTSQSPATHCPWSLLSVGPPLSLFRAPSVASQLLTSCLSPPICPALVGLPERFM